MREEHRIGEIAAWMYRPDDVDGDVPCVVLLHGFTATRHERLPAFCEAFAAAGFASVAFDFRHLGDSGGEPRQLIDLRRQFEDRDAVLAWAREQPGIGPVVVWGTSFAGGHALDAAAAHPWLAAAICLVPLLDGAAPPKELRPAVMAWALGAAMRDELASRLGRPPRLIPAAGPAGARAFLGNDDLWSHLDAFVGDGSPWRNAVAPRVLLRLARHRPVKRAAEVRIPLLIQIATDETLLSNRPAERAAAAAHARLERYPGDHFDPYFPPLFDRVVADQIAFLRDALA